MKYIYRALLILVVMIGWSAGALCAPDQSPLPHGSLSRLDFVTAKSLANGQFDLKNGELGDAAANSVRYDMLRETLDLRIDPSTRSVSGSVQMVFASTYPGLEDFVFDLRDSMQVVSVLSALGPLSFVQGGDSVVVRLMTPLETGDLDSLVVSYGGNRTTPVVDRGLMFKSHLPAPEIPRDQVVPIIANMSQPAYAQTWWPCKDRPDDKFLVTLILTVPDSLTAVANGVLVSETAADPGWVTYRWQEAFPIASYLVSVAISDYVLLSSECNTALGSAVPLRNWVFPGEVADATVDFAPLCEMIDFCESVYGPYPFLGEKYGHAEFLWPGAMEHQTVTSIGSGSVDGNGTHEWLLVHELGHQWFGDSLTPADWADIWLNEGFATYTEALWFEHSVDQAAYFTYLANHRHEADWIAEGPVYDPVPVFPGRVIYDKGAWILHMLRGRMGDPAFFAFVTDWANAAGRHLGSVATADFVSLASWWSSTDLHDFLWPYLNETVLPAIGFQSGVSDGPNGTGTHLRVNLSQLQSPLFDNIFPVVVTIATGQVTLQVPLKTTSAVVEFDLAAAIQNVVLDPQHWVLWREADTGDTPVGLMRVFPNPSAGGYVVFRYWLDRKSQLEMRFFDVMGREIAARDLGRHGPGLREWRWDVTADDGRRIPSGIYWAALYVDGVRSVAKFSVVR